MISFKISGGVKNSAVGSFLALPSATFLSARRCTQYHNGGVI